MANRDPTKSPPEFTIPNEPGEYLETPTAHLYKPGTVIKLANGKTLDLSKPGPLDEPEPPQRE
jgi:hypothetical protein